MGSQKLSYSRSQNIEEQEVPSDYVRLEADLIARQDSDDFAENSAHKKKKTILIYCFSHKLLIEISNDLKAKLEPDVDVLITTEKEVALRLMKSGDIDLLLHGPGSSDLIATYEKLNELSNAAIGSSLVMIHDQNPELEQWMNRSKQSVHLTKAITKLNGTHT